MASEIKLTAFIDHLMDSSVNEGVANVDSKASLLASWVDGENNKTGKDSRYSQVDLWVGVGREVLGCKQGERQSIFCGRNCGLVHSASHPLFSSVACCPISYTVL